MAKDIVRQQIYNQLRSQDIYKRIEAVRLLTRLGVDEALHVIEGVLNVEGNLGMKIEALRILPEFASPEKYLAVSHVLQAALGSDDPEIVRNGLLAICCISPALLGKSVTASLIKWLSSADTDLQYEAIRSFSHLCSELSVEEFISYLSPLTKHPNKFISAEASAALRRVTFAEKKEEK